MQKDSNSKAIVHILMLLAAVFVVCSCKKSPEAGVPGQPRQQSADNAKNQDANTEKADSDVSKPAPGSSETLMPIDIKLPKPMFVGTPQNVQVTNLEKPLGAPRPPFLAPEGTRNVALGKPVVSSDREPIIGEVEMITDGDKEAADGSYIELAPSLQSVTIDLGEECDIYAVLLWHYHKEARVYFDVVVQAADDPDFIVNVRTLFNNDDDNSAGLGAGSDMHYVETAEGKLIDAGGVRARYVRLYSNGNSSNELNHYIEVEVFGKPAI
jgi:hypothetical protein